MNEEEKSFYDKFRDQLKNDGMIEKGDLDQLLTDTKNFVLHQFLNDDCCKDGSCEVCGIKNKLREEGMKKGAEKGFTLGQKNPGAKIGS